jgi:hypothetical protein
MPRTVTKNMLKNMLEHVMIPHHFVERVVLVSHRHVLMLSTAVAVAFAVSSAGGSYSFCTTSDDG